MGGRYRQAIVAGTQHQVELFQALVADATLDSLAGDDGVAAHAEAGEAAVGQHAGIIGHAAAVEGIEHVDLVFLDDEEVAVDRRDEVAHVVLGLVPRGGRPVRGEACRFVLDVRVVLGADVDLVGQAEDDILQRVTVLYDIGVVGGALA